MIQFKSNLSPPFRLDSLIPTLDRKTIAGRSVGGLVVLPLSAPSVGCCNMHKMCGAHSRGANRTDIIPIGWGSTRDMADIFLPQDRFVS